MESTGNEEAHTLYSEIDIKEEPIWSDPYQQPFEEIEQIYIKEENVKLEIPDDFGACDPLQVKKEVVQLPAESPGSAVSHISRGAGATNQCVSSCLSAFTQQACTNPSLSPPPPSELPEMLPQSQLVMRDMMVNDGAEFELALNYRDILQQEEEDDTIMLLWLLRRMK